MPVSERLQLRRSLKAAISLRRRANRTTEQRFLVEGLRELRAALTAGWQVDTLFCCKALYKGELDAHIARLSCPQYGITQRDFARLAYREDSGGLVAVLNMQTRHLSSLRLGAVPLIFVLDGIEKPGNVGAILRIAAAAGVDALLFCGRSDPYNPNVLRNSLGAGFVVPWAQTTAAEVQAWTQQQGLQLLGLDPGGSTLYTEATLRQGTALILGAEASGLQGNWRSTCTQLLQLPMKHESIDSLNVASCAAIVAYEALRQRNTQSVSPCGKS